mgnify:CR=1 FL=1
MPAISFKNVSYSYVDGDESFLALEDIDLEIADGEFVCLIGHSGCGKSTLLSLLAGLSMPTAGEILIDNVPVSGPGPDRSIVFQSYSLFPWQTALKNVMFSIRQTNKDISKEQAKVRAMELLAQVGMEDAANRYPYQLSGGMRQRVMIAMALACKPQLLIADEPTTALDVTVQAQILALISELQKEIGMAVLFITHDMGVVAQIADRVAVMRYGEIVESGTAQAIFAHPQHPYTQALLSAVPRLGALKDIEHPCFFRLIDPDNGKVIEPPSDKLPPPGETILEVKNLVKTFPVRTDFWGRPTYVVRACDHVSFDLRAGETLSIVGESGCGKSTTGRAVLRLLDVDSGEVLHRGKSLLRMTRHELQEERRNLQMIFQDPYASLDPRQTVGYSIAEPMMIHNYCSKKEMYDRVALLLKRVGLSPDMANRYPHEFSGGQRQRICIARALSLKPQIIVADECVAALDVSIRAQVVNLMMELQEEMGLSYIFISHDMGVVERISHRVAVMYLGQIVEMGSRRAVLGNPLHPYTQKLLSAVPIADPQERNLLKLLNLSDLPSPVRKVGDDPVIEPLVEVEPGHFVAKHVVGTMEGHK